MITHTFVAAPFYPDRCDAIEDDSGRPRRCCQPKKDHTEVSNLLNANAPVSVPACPQCHSSGRVFDAGLSWGCKDCGTRFIP
jgi:hypothetical protein